MSQVPWAEMLRFGLCELRLDPDTFWSLTPAELMVMSGLNVQGASILTSQGLAELMKQFPDKN